jgi:hypothetical protein
VDVLAVTVRPQSPSRGDRVKHGYPPPAQPAGTVVKAYCGLPMVVAGEYDDAPPGDACPLCALAWEDRRDAP